MELRRPIESLIGRTATRAAASEPGAGVTRSGSEWGHPADLAPLVREAVTIAADLAGLGLGVASTAVRFLPLPGRFEATAVLGMLESVPQLRRRAEDLMGAPLADLVLGVANALGQGLAQGPVGPLADLAYRTSRLSEMRARRRAWLARRPGLGPAPSSARNDGTPVERVVPLPPGPLDRYAGRAFVASLVGFGSGLLATGDPQRAVVALHAGLPRAARFGREAFASRLGTILARRGVVVFDPWALRLLDRVDCLVVEAALLCDPDRPDQPSPSGLSLLAAARRAGLRAVVVTPGEPAWASLAADELANGADAAATVRLAQEQGRVVCAVGIGTSPALAVADCGIGLCPAGEPVPWHSHLVAGEALDEAELVVEACAAAVRASRQSIALAVSGGILGAALGFGGRLTGGPERAMAAVHGSSLLAVLNGRRLVRGLGSRLAPVATGGQGIHR